MRSIKRNNKEKEGCLSEKKKTKLQLPGRAAHGNVRKKKIYRERKCKKRRSAVNSA